MFDFELLAQVRQKNPLVHNITNIVSAHFSANGLLAIGASPFMSSTPEEMAQVAQIADVLVINMGAVSGAQIATMLVAGKAMNHLGKPVVLDPVGAPATLHRQQTVEKLLQDIKFTLIRGNASEIAFLAGEQASSKGVDAGDVAGDVAILAKHCANRYQSVVAISGAVDYVSDGDRTFAIDNGTPMFPKITASGCLLACVCGAFVAVGDDALTATVQACASYGVAGQLTAERLKPHELGQFYVGFLDNLAAMDNKTLQQFAKIRPI